MIYSASQRDRSGQDGLEVVMAECDGFDVQRRPVGKRIRVRMPLSSVA